MFLLIAASQHFVINIQQYSLRWNGSRVFCALKVLGLKGLLGHPSLGAYKRYSPTVFWLYLFPHHCYILHTITTKAPGRLPHSPPWTGTVTFLIYFGNSSPAVNWSENSVPLCFFFNPKYDDCCNVNTAIKYTGQRNFPPTHQLP